MKPLALLAVLLSACTSAQLAHVDPVCTVEGQTCPDAHGVPQPLLCGFTCCASQNLGPGQCSESSSCMLPDGCTSTPLPDNEFGARKVTRRAGL